MKKWLIRRYIAWTCDVAWIMGNALHGPDSRFWKTAAFVIWRWHSWIVRPIMIKVLKWEEEVWNTIAEDF